MNAAVSAPGPESNGVLSRFLLPACLSVFLAVSAVGWDNTILDDHGFRQTQTAISTYYMVGQPPRFEYETPVLGPPWEIPFEFPVFQWLTAALVTVFQTPLEQTGRFVSVTLYLLCVIAANAVLNGLRWSRDARIITLSLMLMSPFYLFWSRTFMIESTALFFSLSYLAFAVVFCNTSRIWNTVGAIVTGILAGLVKVTTLAPFILAVLLVWIYRERHPLPGDRHWSRLTRLSAMSSIIAFPVLAAIVWTWYTDGVRELNQFGQYTTSHVLRDWTVGTLAQRLSLETWAVIFARFGLVLGHLSIGILACVALWMAGRRRLEAAACFALALTAPLLFTNLHFVHEYYAYANGVFLIAALGLALGGLMEHGGRYRRCGNCLLVTVVVVAAWRYTRDYYPKQAGNHLQAANVGDAIRRITRPDDVILILGCDWSPEIPFYSQRRAMMIPDWPQVSVDRLAQYLEKLEPYRLGAVIVNDRDNCRFDADMLARVLGRYQRAGCESPSQQEVAGQSCRRGPYVIKLVDR
jgi:hypothetical protein